MNVTDPKNLNTPQAKVAKLAGEKAEQIFRLLVDAVTDYAIFALDTEGYILTWNKGAQRLKGYSSDEIIGRHFSTFYTQSDIERKHPQEELEVAKAKGKFEEEGWRVRKDGSLMWANVIINKLVDESGEHIGFAKVTRDLTERRKSEETLRQSEERLRLMIAGVRDYAIFMLDPNGNVASWNEGAKRIKQYEASEIIGKHFSRFYPEEEIRAGKPDIEIKTATDQGRFEDEGWRVKKDGSRFWANVILTAVRNADGKLIGFTKITRDLSERKAAELQMQELNESLEKKVQQRTSELLKLTQHLELAVKSRDDFLSIASHELNTPLTTLKLQIQLRKKKIEAKRMDMFQAENIEQMVRDDEKQINRLSRLVDDMLDITRLSSGKLSLHLEEINICELTEQVVNRFRPQFQAVGCEVTTIYDCEKKGTWDPYRIEQIIANLLTNAMKYGPERPVEVSVRSNDNEVILKVRDHGKGIAPADQDRIFLQFERATSASEVSGLGLGLFIVKQLIEAHQGTIRVESQIGEGSCFIVCLPLETKS